MLALGLLLGIITALFKAIDTMMNKSLMGNTSPIEHSLYRIVFVIPFLFLSACFNWNIRADAILPLIVYGGIEAVNILFHQLAIKSLNPIHAEVLSKSKALFTYVIGIVLTVQSVSVDGVAGVLIFILGMLFSIDFKKVNPKEFADVKGYIFEIISVLARTVKPFILRALLISESVSNEVLACFSMVVAFCVIWIIFRPKLGFDKIDVKRYSLQALFVAISMITSGYAVLYAGALLASMLENFSVFFVIVISMILYKTKQSKNIWIGAILAVVGVVLTR